MPKIVLHRFLNTLQKISHPQLDSWFRKIEIVHSGGEAPTAPWRKAPEHIKLSGIQTGV